jgi:hypothetical protein
LAGLVVIQSPWFGVVCGNKAIRPPPQLPNPESRAFLFGGIMGKRFFETRIWEKPWFRKLRYQEKAAWFYITSKCDNVGVWDSDFELAEFSIGDKIDWETLKKNCNGNIEVLSNGKWWVCDFCQFQHGDLFSRKQSSVLNSYMGLLQKHNLMDRVREQFNNTLPSVKGLGLGKGIGKGINEKKEPQITFDFKTGLFENVTDELVEKWQGGYPALDVDQQMIRMSEWLIAHPEKRKKNYRRFITGWLSRSQERGGK